MTVVSLSSSNNLYPPNCITHTVLGDTIHAERVCLSLLVTDSCKASYEIDNYNELYDIIIVTLCYY